jgi:cytochrome b561
MNIPGQKTHVSYDLLLRLTHAWVALAVIGLIATSQVAEFFEHSPTETTVWQVHVQFGYALIGGLLVRLMWGFVGPKTARWSDLWHPRAWGSMLKGKFHFAPRLGHDVRASLVFIGFYGVLLMMAATGLIMAANEFQMGPLSRWPGGTEALSELAEEPHEAGLALVLAFIVLHVAALLYHRFVLRIPVDQAMITGKQYLPDHSGDGTT